MFNRLVNTFILLFGVYLIISQIVYLSHTSWTNLGKFRWLYHKGFI